MKTKEKIHVGNLIAEEGKVYEFAEITGCLDARKADAGAFQKLTTVGGSADFQGWTGSAPKLTTVGGSADFQGWTGSAPKLTTVGGYADFHGWTGSAPKLTTVGGSAYFRGWTGSAPKLTTVGGYADFHGWTGSAQTIKMYEADASEKCRKDLSESFRRNGYHLADGILAKIVATRGRVSRVIVCGKTAVSYVVEGDGGVFSHGATLKEARESLVYKLTSRDTSQFSVWKLSKVITKAEAIQAYRAITGACEGGVRGFCESVDVPDKLTVADAVKLTAGQYGAELFAKFFEGKK